MNTSRKNPARKILKHVLAVSLLSTAITTAVLASSQTYRTSSSTPSNVEFNFRVTLIPVPGKVNDLSAKLNFDPKDLSKTSGTVNVNLAKLDTGIGLRDEHARGYIGAEKHPNAIFTLNRIEGVKALEAGKEVKGTAIGSFDLNGIKKPLSAPITLKLEGSKLNVSTAFNVTLQEHKIEIPGADPKVDVKVNFTLEPRS